MRYLIIFWCIYVVLFILFIVSRFIKDKEIKKGTKNAIAFIGFMSIFFLIIAIVTDDPFFQDIGIPKEYEWLAGLLISGFTLWQTYLNPLKDRVTKTEIDVGSIKTDVSAIKTDVGMIKEKIINGKIKKD